jgi:tetratricopeptide (TPR) repeat protein
MIALQNPLVHFYNLLFRACGVLEGSADVEPLRNAVEAARPSDERDVTILQIFRLVAELCARNPQGIEEALRPNTRPRIIHLGSTYPKAWFQALAYRLRGDEERAQNAFAAARSDMESVVQAEPADARPLSVLAMIDAGLGRSEQAVREGERAREIAAAEESPVEVGVIASNLAVVYAWTGQRTRAIALLEEAATQPAGAGLMYQPTYGDLRLNPIWDSLRNEPRFNALVERLAPRAALPATEIE